jgi:sugar diacid utilization regulator
MTLPHSVDATAEDGRDFARWVVGQLAKVTRVAAEANRRHRRVVLGLLLDGHAIAAQRLADAMEAPLPEAFRVLVVSCADTDPVAVAATLRRIVGAEVWVMPQTDDIGLLLVLHAAQPHDADDGPARRLARDLIHHHPRCRVGASSIVGLTQVRDAYEQATHALDAAQFTVGGYSRFHAWLDPALLVSRQGAGWAREQLLPLDRHRPARHGDPDAAELTRTVDIWLTSPSGASTKLGIHRNTLSGRLRLVETLLDRDFGKLADRAEVLLAMRIAALTSDLPQDPPPRSFSPLHLPALDAWAHAGLRNLIGGTAGFDAETLRVWLRNDARLAPTADALGLTVPGARKRMLRIGGSLGLDLLHQPTAQADVWLAMRIVDGAPISHTLAAERRAS